LVLRRKLIYWHSEMEVELSMRSGDEVRVLGAPMQIAKLKICLRERVEEEPAALRAD